MQTPTKLLFLVLFISSVNTVFGQSSLVRGEIRNQNKQPVPFATVALLSATDSTLVKAGTTNEMGVYEFSFLRAGSYRIGISVLGYSRWASPIFTVADGQLVFLEPVIVQEAATKLSEVTVSARKPLIEVLPDKLVFNVEGSINATGSTALELLQKSPGVVVDRDDNVLLKGSNGVRIYIDGKPSPLSAGDLSAYLRSLPSSDIEAIEIITQPSAKYDAAGNAGIINIRLRKDKRLGTNGTVAIGLGQGQYFPKFNGSLSLNHRTKTVNWFGSYSNRTARDWSYINLYREQVGTVFDQRSQTRAQNLSHNLKAGADFLLSKKSTLGILFNGNASDYSASTVGRTPIGPVGQPIQQLLIANNRNESNRWNLNSNLNYRYADTSGRELSVDADYGNYAAEGNQFQPNQYVNPTETKVLSERIYRMERMTNLHMATLKADYVQQLWKGKLGVGFKLSEVRTNNAFDFFDVVDNRDLLNPDRTNQFVYTERINAGYFSYSRSVKKWQYQAGLRIEDTRSEGNLSSVRQQADAYVRRHYLNAFPSAGLTYNQNQNNTFGLTYSRRIDRPTYQDLNPFESKLDELTYQKGNAFLRPQYTDNVELSHTYKYTLNTSLGYSFTRDYFTSITDTTERNRNYITTRNLASREAITLSVSYPFRVAKWWNVYANLSGYRSINRADLGQGRMIRLAANVFSLYAQHTFTLPGKLTLELSGFYTSPSVWGGTFLNRQFGGIDLGLQRKVWSDKGTVKVSLSDVLHTMQWRGISQFGGLYMDASGGWESRVIRVNFSYNFGNNQVKAARQRKTGLEEESGRVQ